MSKKVSEYLYELAKDNHYDYFIDLLYDIAEADQKVRPDSRQIEILIDLDFFSEFANQRELRQITYVFTEVLKSGKAKSVRKEKASDAGIESAFVNNANGLTKAGTESKSWTELDMVAIMHAAEEHIKGLHIPDLSLAEKAKRYADVAGYVGFTTGEDKDRSSLYVKEVTPLKRKSDGRLFGYSIFYTSIGSGIDGRMTLFKGKYDRDPIEPGDVIKCLKYTKDGKYFQLRDYTHI